MSEIADILDRAADLIEPEGAWTTEVEVRDADGFELDDLYDPRAACFCAGGAVFRAASMDGDAWPALHFLESLVGGDVPEWNDAFERTQAEVVAKLREAAAKARGESV